MKDISVSVRFLVEQALLSGDLAAGGGESLSPLEGLRAHQKIQRSRPGDYQSEVPVSGSFEKADYLLHIKGRLDGLFRDGNHRVVEEIKSTRKDLKFFKERENPIHWGQAKIYSFLIADAEGLKSLDTQLTYYNVDTRKILEIRRAFPLNELYEFFHRTLENWVRWQSAQDEWIELRNRSLAGLQFPFPEYRPGQREMAVAVYRSIRDRKELLVQAPTGIGKTAAAVFPTLKAQREGLAGKAFYLTARTTGKAIAENVLNILRGKGARIRSVTLTAKEKICFNPGTACDAEECRFARGYYDRLAEARWELVRLQDYDRPAIEAAAEKYALCPFELSLDLSNWSDFVISDYNYAFDPRVYLRRHFSEGPAEDIFIIDEAHNLVDRSRDMYSATLEKGTVLKWRRRILKSAPGPAKHLMKINSWFLKKGKGLEDGETAEKDPPLELLPLLRQFLGEAEQWLTRPKNRRSPLRDEIFEAFFELSWFAKVLESYERSYSSCYVRTRKDVRLRLFCIDPSDRLRQTLERCRSAIFFSATLTPQSYFRQLFGCREDAARLVLPSPFPRRNLCVVLHSGISTIFKDREASCLRLARSIERFVSRKPGNYLVFFPSYRYLEMTLGIFSDLYPDTKVIVQGPGMSEAERDDFLNEFQSENRRTVVGFAVLGGAFGEGIDLVGDRLNGAVVVGVGLPAICLERELIREYFSAQGRNGFDFAYRFPGINRVLQAAGRVIRTEEDRGAVLLAGRRFARYDYRSLLPSEWQIRQVSSWAQIDKALEWFWDTGLPDDGELES